MAKKPNLAIALLMPLPLYGAVLSGLYLLSSGWAAIVGYHIAMVTVLALSGGLSRLPTLFRGFRPLLGVAMTLVCLLSGVVLYILFPFIVREGVELAPTLERLGLSGLSWVAFIAYYSLVNPWIEELFWRGFYPDQVRLPLLSDLFFAGYHVFVLLLFVGPGWALLTFAVLASTAWIWRAISRRCGGLLIPCVSHLSADVSVIAAAALLAA